MMKNKLVFILIILILSGCSASWHINRAEYKDPSLFEVKRDTVFKIEKRDTIIHLDTLISIILPNDKVIIDTTFKKLKPYSFKPIYSKNGIINVEVWMKRGTLHLVSYLDSAMMIQLKKDILIRDAIITNLTEVTTEQNTIIKNQKTFIQELKSNLKWIIIVVLVIVIAGLAFKFVKWIKK